MSQATIVNNIEIDYEEILRACSLLFKTSKNTNVADTEKCLAVLKKYFSKENQLLDPNKFLKDQNGNESWTPLLCCCFMEFNEGVNFLLEQGANPNIVGGDGKSPLSVSALKNKLFIPTKLIKKGALLNYIDKQGKTALMQACEIGNSEIVKLFLDNSADIKIKSKENKDCIAFAMEKCHYNIVKYVENFYFDKILVKKIHKKSKKQNYNLGLVEEELFL